MQKEFYLTSPYVSSLDFGFENPWYDFLINLLGRYFWSFLIGFLVFAARERTISPADLQGILGMMAYDQRTGGSTRGLSSYFPRGFNPRGSRQVLN